MFSPFRVIAATALAVAVGLPGPTNAAAAPVDDARSVRELADAIDLSFGVAVDRDSLADATYGALVADNATTISTRDELSFAVVQPTQGSFDFGAAEEVVDFAVDHGLTVRGHDLIAPDELPAWITQGTWDATTLTDVLTDHVTTVIAHFDERNPGVITEWDVAARVVRADGTQRPSVLQSVLGDSWLDTAFAAARAADPDATLYYDDFYDDLAMAQEAAMSGNAIVPGADASRSTCDLVAKCVAVSAMVRGLLDRGVPIDGVGFESHLFSPEPLDLATFSSWVSDTGLSWAVTEFAVPLPATEVAAEEMLAYQAEIYGAALTACIDSPDCATFITWGVSDGSSSIAAETGGVYGGALWFDVEGRPKPAHDAVRGVLVARAPAAAPATTEVPASIDAGATALADESTTAEAATGADSSSALQPILIAVGAVAAVAVVVLVLRRRRSA